MEISVQFVLGPQDGDGVLNGWFYEPTWPIHELPVAEPRRELMARAGRRRCGRRIGTILGVDSRVAVLAPLGAGGGRR